MEKKISIIVPAYNVEKYIRYSLDSIINQTYKNLEIIVVDDGTPDNSGKIADEYATKDSRIKVRHKENGGLASARNSGLDIATGEYITFLDSDDCIYPEFMQKLYNMIESSNADVSECAFLRVDEDNLDCYNEILKKENDKIEEKIEEYDGKTALEILYGPNLHPYVKKVVVWNKMYKKELWKNLRFPEGKLHEDEFTTFKVLNNVQKIVSTNLIMNAYIQSKDSIMRRDIKQKRIDDNLGAYLEGIEYFKGNNEIQAKVMRRYLENCIELSGKVMNSQSGSKDEKLQSIEALYNKYYQEYIDFIRRETVDSKEIKIIDILDSAYKNMREKDRLVGNEWGTLEILVNQVS